MELTITMNLDNDAFAEDNGAEAARILHDLASHMKFETLEPGDVYTLTDINGNGVGRAVVRDGRR
jgi:hypothetical protein